MIKEIDKERSHEIAIANFKFIVPNETVNRYNETVYGYGDLIEDTHYMYPLYFNERLATREEVESLKKNWLEDPCWDIGGTEGFEEYINELTTFHEEQAEQWFIERKERFDIQCAEMGIKDNPVLAEYILKLEYRISQLDEELDNLQHLIK